MRPANLIRMSRKPHTKSLLPDFMVLHRPVELAPTNRKVTQYRWIVCSRDSQS